MKFINVNVKYFEVLETINPTAQNFPIKRQSNKIF